MQMQQMINDTTAVCNKSKIDPWTFHIETRQLTTVLLKHYSAYCTLHKYTFNNLKVLKMGPLRLQRVQLYKVLSDRKGYVYER